MAQSRIESNEVGGSGGGLYCLVLDWGALYCQKPLKSATFCRPCLNLFAEGMRAKMPKILMLFRRNGRLFLWCFGTKRSQVRILSARLDLRRRVHRISAQMEEEVARLDPNDFLMHP